MHKKLLNRSLWVASCLPWLSMMASPKQADPRDWTVPQWETWRDAEIGKILTPSFEAGGQKLLVRADLIGKSNEAYRFLAPLVSDPTFLADPARKAALSNFVRFTTAQHWMALKNGEGVRTNELGLDIQDRDYWAVASRYLAFPELLRSQRFLQSMSDPAGYQAAVQMIEDQNAGRGPDQKWMTFLFRAQFIKSVDKTTYGRLLVVVPNTKTSDGRVLDRWFSFAIATPDQVPAPVVRSVSLVSVLRDPSAQNESQGFFSDFMRDRDPATGAFSLNPTSLMSPCPSKNCYDCHKSAVLPIRPKAVFRFDEGGKLVASEAPNATPEILNAIIFGYGRSSFSHLDAGAYGPCLAPLGKSRPDAFIAVSTRDHPLPVESYARIRANMKCSGCHEGLAQLNGLLALGSDQDVHGFEAKMGLAQTYVEKGYMPPGNTLSPTERHALWECVAKEYFDSKTKSGLFVDWLRGR